MNGTEAREFLLKSGLDQGLLGQIWTLSDQDKDSALSPAEFCIAMFLCHAALEGRPLPPSLPPSLIAMANGVNPNVRWSSCVACVGGWRGADV